ncbi:transporter substrate-binding domain-containing protein [Lampropedia puyangensis]|uniref:Transporter substrate-binding domain-containing protein n=1 Tax=Lampropedia puyangensis TaxID=1330072 RepID=A0A4S8EWS6_9BURK|nr:NrtA/SsuA/CpmA family ABC transporter substrate-binding protein [Lampropedia puyangensis]THT99006.1 transporter substrate-binding domain-containing protein [Lampropedia puyangensis]
MLSRRLLLATLSSCVLALSIATPAQAQDKVIKVGTLKLIHGITPYFYDQFTPPGYKIEVLTFETPTDGKNAIVTKSVDFGTFGLAAATLGAAAGEPVTIIAPQSNGGMAIVAKKGAGISSFKELKGKRVGVLPGTTQEAVFLERLKAEGMTIKDVQSVRVSFSEMASALERGDVDAYVGAEPGPSISVSRGVGEILELPYSTPAGSINMVMATHSDKIKGDPETVKVFLEIHKKATEFANSNRPALIEKAGAVLGLSPELADLAANNVELAWKIDDAYVDRAKFYGSLMLERKQIRRLPNYETFINTDLAPK